MSDMSEIWREVHQGLHAFIAKRVADETEVDDIVQDVWLKMQRGISAG
jgi:RNA polymerase sigma-70 factor, ECF subfamily